LLALSMAEVKSPVHSPLGLVQVRFTAHY